MTNNNPQNDDNGRPVRAGQVMRQVGATATAVHTAGGLRWRVRRDRDGLARTTHCLAHTGHWKAM